MSKYNKDFKLRRVGSSVRVNVSAHHLEILRVMRDMIISTGQSIDMTASEFQSYIPDGWARNESPFAMALEMLGRQKFIVRSSHGREWSYVKCHGIMDLVLTKPDGSEEKFEKIYANDIPEKVRALYDNLNRYYVYVYKVDGNVVYVGKGVGRRIKHYGSKIEHNGELIGLAREGVEIEAVKIAENLSEEMASRLEEMYLLAVLGSGGKLLNTALSLKVKKELGLV